MSSFMQLGYRRIDDVFDDDEYPFYSDTYDGIFEAVEGQSGFKQLGGVDARGRQLMPQVNNPCKTCPALLETRYFGRIREVARTLLGPEAQFTHDHMILKPAGTSRDTPWHQDQSYHSPEFRYRSVNFWLPLDGATVEEGCLWFVPGTHLGPIVPHATCLDEGGAEALQAVDQAYWHANGQPVPCPRGAVTVHHAYCLHYAGPNESRRPRRAYTCSFALSPMRLARPLVFPWADPKV